MMRSIIVLGGLALGLAGCGDPYSPGQRALGGGLGAVGGAATTPQREPTYRGY